MKFLVIDDDAAALIAVGNALRILADDAVVREESSCANALATLSQEPFDCILVDYRMPAGDVIAVVEAAREKAHAPVFVLTGRDDERAAVAAMNACATDFLPRGDLDPQALARAIARSLRLYRAEQAAEKRLEDLLASESRFRRLTESNLIGIISYHVDGRIPEANMAFLSLVGYTRDDLEAGLVNWKSLTPPEYAPLDEEMIRRLQTSETSPVFEKEYLRRDGGRVSVLVYGMRAPDGGDLGMAAVLDITERKNAERSLAFLADASRIIASTLDYRTTLRSIARLAVESLADLCTIDMIEGDEIRRLALAHRDPVVEARLRSTLMANPLDLRPDHPVIKTVESGETQFSEVFNEESVRRIARNPEHERILSELNITSYIVVPLIARGRTIGALSLVAAHPWRRYDERNRVVAEELARRAAVAVDNARLLAETRARAEREELVNAIGRKLRNSLDASEIIGLATIELGRALNVEVASWSWVISDGVRLQIAPQQYYAPGAVPLIGNYLLSDLPSEITALWHEGRPFVANDLQGDEQLLEKLRRKPMALATRAVIAHPIFVRDSWSGILAVHQASDSRRWTDNEIALVAAISEIVGLALDNARKYAREHRVADMLTLAFLANIPERLPGLRVTTTYHAGLDESRVGGDFYDAFSLPDGRVALVMADVSGKGLSAAVQTASVKYSLRAFAAEAAAPALVIRRLNHILSRESSGLGEHFVTLFYAVYDPATGRFAYVSAGHETQILRRAGGGVVLLKATGPILGITDYDYEQSVEYLEPFDTVVLFTDGLTEARNGRHELLEIDRVVDLIGDIPADAGSAAIASSLVGAAMNWAGGRPQDDLALMVVQRDERSRYTDVLPAASVPADRLVQGELLFDFTFPSLPDYAAEVRQAVAHWMGTLMFGRLEIEDFQTAVTESVTNAVRYGSPMGENDRFNVRGYRREDGALLVEVRDYGPGMKIPLMPIVMPSPTANGGRGLPLMAALSDEVEFLPAKDGFRVRLVKSLPGG